jgi:hypothetical protein
MMLKYDPVVITADDLRLMEDAFARGRTVGWREASIVAALVIGALALILSNLTWIRLFFLL